MALLRLLLPAALCLLSGCTRMFFFPSGKIYMRPEDHGAKYETLKFPSTDGEELTGLYFPARSEPNLGTVVHFHGNAENMTSHFGYSYWLADFGFDVLAFDYRGYGASEGRPTVKGAVRDGVAAIQYVQARKPGGKVFVFGQSLGGAIALGSLAEAGAEGVAAIALESPVSTYRGIAREKLSGGFLGFLSWPLGFIVSDKHQPLEAIRELPARPLVVIHGTADPIVPYHHGKALFDAAKEPKQLWTVEGGAHTAAFMKYGAEYRKKLVDYFRAASALETEDFRSGSSR